jgi:hypothetical protein
MAICQDSYDYYDSTREESLESTKEEEEFFFFLTKDFSKRISHSANATHLHTGTQNVSKLSNDIFPERENAHKI